MNFRIPLLIALCCSQLTAQSTDPRAALGPNYAAPDGIGRELLGTRPPEWEIREWIQSPPLTLAQLRGKVVLVRWWTGPQCPYCTASADTLNALWRKERERDLVVVGLYHHKESTPLTRQHVEAQIARLGFDFPVGIDENWAALHRWWLDGQPRGWTSVTFLLDRAGRIRHVHPGGAYFPGEPGHAALAAAVAKELAR